MTEQDGVPAALDAERFRRVLGNYPTGVAAITAVAADGIPVAMVVGSFGSVSLDPPLVMYMPAKESTSYADLRGLPSFCVNVLGADQEELCRTLSLRGSRTKLEGVPWHPAAGGAPIVDGSIAWIECALEQVVDAGDHDIVIGRVVDLDTSSPEPALPLVFYQGGFGRFSAHSRVVPTTRDAVGVLGVVAAVRAPMETLAEELGVECIAVGLVERWVVALASAGTPSSGQSPMPIGVRLPFEAPQGALMVAWEGEATRRRWLREGTGPRDESLVAAHLAALDRVRERGWTVSLVRPETSEMERHIARLAEGDASAMQDLRAIDSRIDDPSEYEIDEIEPEKEYRVRHISAPVFDATGRVAVYLSLRGLPERTSGARLRSMIDRLTAVAASAAGVRA